jgi:hypothetical protein
MAGSVGVPTPWWQLEGPVGRDPRAAVSNLEASAPPGYQYDRVAMKYVPIVGSATDALAQRARGQSIEDQLLGSFGATTGTGAGGGGAATTGATGSGFPAVSYDTETLPNVAWPGSFGGAPGAPGGATSTAQPTERIAAPDTSAALAAVFNRAKDQVGKTTTGSLTALRTALASRGLLGGGVEGNATGRVVTAGQGQLADTSREQAIQEGTRLNDFAKLGYQGAIEQRGQDITTSEGAANRALDASKAAYSGMIQQRGQNVDAAGTKFSGGITQRGQDITAANAAADRAVGTRGQNLGALSTLLTKLY